MIKKKLLMNGKIVEMNVVEAMKMSGGLIKTIVDKQYNSLSKRPDFAYISKEDLEQEVKIEIMKSFKTYDVSKNTAFTTYYYEGVMNYFKNLNRQLLTDKRDIKGMLFISLQEQVNEDGEEKGDIISKECEELIDAELEILVSELLKSMSLDEKKVFLNKLLQNKTQEQLAKEIGISRQGLHARMGKYTDNWTEFFENIK